MRALQKDGEFFLAVNGAPAVGPPPATSAKDSPISDGQGVNTLESTLLFFGSWLDGCHKLSTGMKKRALRQGATTKAPAAVAA